MTPTDIRLRLFYAGFLPVPLIGKNPNVNGKDWQLKRLRTNKGEIELWGSMWPDAKNTGVLCRNTPFLDLDIFDPEAAEVAEALVAERFDGQYILTRFGLPPKRAIPFQTAQPFKKISVVLIPANAESLEPKYRERKIEFLCDGQQCVVDGIHPDTGKPYHWPHGVLGEVVRDDLPGIDGEQAQKLVDDKHGYRRKDENKKPRTDSATGNGHADWGDLLDNLIDHDKLAVFAMSLLRAGTSVGAAVNLLRAHVDRLKAVDPDRKERRLAEIPDMVASARAKLSGAELPLGDPPRFKLVPFHEIALQTAPAYLVEGLVPRVGLIVIWGPMKCGKSFWTFDLFMHVALGWPYRSRKVHQGDVVYLSLEGNAGFNRRVEAFRKERGVTDAPFYLITDRANLVKDHHALIAAIKAASVQPAAVVIDTLNRSLPGSESKDEDMSAYVKAADAVRDAFDCAVIVIHHCGVNEKRPRGHTSLGGAVDAQLAVRRDAANNIVAEVEWMKDGDSEGDAIISKLDRFDLGVDDDGNEISSCVVMPSEAPATDTTDDKLNKNQKTMFSILYDTGSRGLTLTEWHKAAREAGIGIKRKADLFDLRSALQSKGLIYQSNDRWIARRE